MGKSLSVKFKEVHQEAIRHGMSIYMDDREIHVAGLYRQWQIAADTIHCEGDGYAVRRIGLLKDNQFTPVALLDENDEFSFHKDVSRREANTIIRIAGRDLHLKNI